MNRAIPALVLAVASFVITGCAEIPTPMQAAIQNQDVVQVQKLLDAGTPVDQGTGSSATPLMLAAGRGQIEIAKLLISRGANIGATDLTQATALFYAVRTGHADVAALLLDKGADVNAMDCYLFIRSDHQEGKCYKSEPPDMPPLAYAAEAGSVPMINLLLSRGADPGVALAGLDRWADEFASKETGAGLKRGAGLLKRMADSWRAKQQSTATSVSKDDIKQIVQAAVADAAKAPAPKDFHSDVDAPSFHLPERPKDFAVVVGLAKYSDIPEAQFGDRDGEAVRDHLLAMGFPSRNVVYLTGEKAGYTSIQKFVETWLPRNVDETSRVFFYFSGHGAPDPTTGKAYLLPYDGDPSFLENTAYPTSRLYQKLGELKAKQVIVALDSCFSGAGGRSLLAKGARPLVTKVDTGKVPANLTVFAAASGDQITSTLEDQGHGTFTYYFLKGLSGAAKSGDGAVTTRGLYDYLKPKVQDAARRQNRDQAPVLDSREDRELARF